MDLAQYRRELKNYHAAREKNRLEKYLGAAETIPTAAIAERYSDLFSASSVSDLEKSLANADELTETETKARRNLLNISRLGFLQNQAKEISDEYENCRQSTRVSFQNENLSFPEAFSKIQTEETAILRREIYARLSEARNSCADLFLEKFKIFHENAGKIGFENYRKLFAEITGIDFEIFGQTVEKFLAATDETYFKSLSEIFPDEKSPHLADFYFRRKQLERNEIFNGKKLPVFYRLLLENFNFQPEKITNARLLETSAEKQTSVFRPDFPLPEVYFAYPARGGSAAFIEFLKAFGKAQQAAWTSADLANRFPEFVFSPDAVLGEAYGFLFQSLLADESFLRLNFGLWNEKLTGKIAAENKFFLLFEIRRNALRFLFELKFHVSLNAEIAREFVEVWTQNLGFQASETNVLFQLSEDFASLKSLRAAQFAFGLKEYLRSRYDFDWWTKRAAFEELIDFWNTAERYKAEEMARMIGFEMSFDLMKEIK
ncbi:MAG TPA: hypothetical protein VF721_14310 [Pyrinomonadaceae bacterium]|jgi:hypothetical protein